MTVVKNLQAARDLLAGEGAWLQGTFAGIDGEGNAAVGWSDPKANCWCMLGAMGKVSANGVDTALTEKALEDTVTSSGHRYHSNLRIVSAFNDAKGRTQEEILAVFDKAIAVETLKAARELIADESKWTKGAVVLRRREDGSDCYCAVGAVGIVVGGDNWLTGVVTKGVGKGDWPRYDESVFDPYEPIEGAALDFLNKAAQEKSGDRYVDAWRYNDSPNTTHEQALAMFDKAIELASAS